MKLSIVLNFQPQPDIPPQMSGLEYLELVKGSMSVPTETSQLPITGQISLPDGTPVGNWTIDE